LQRKKGPPFIKKALFGLLKNPELFDKGMKAFATMQGLFLKHEEQKVRAPRGLLRQFGKRFDEEFLLPEISKESFRDTVQELEDVEDAQATAIFFTGCSVNYFYPEVGNDLIYVLKKIKYE